MLGTKLRYFFTIDMMQNLIPDALGICRSHVGGVRFVGDGFFAGRRKLSDNGRLEFLVEPYQKVHCCWWWRR
jgi:hypothetical protein